MDTNFSTSTGIKIIKRVYTNGSLALNSNANSNSKLNNDHTPAAISSLDDDQLIMQDISDDVHTHGNSNSLINDLNATDLDKDSKISHEESMSLTAEQKEELIEKLETKKYNLKIMYKEKKDKEIVIEYKEVCSLLSKIKECDAFDKIKDSISDSKVITLNFRKKFKELAVTDFNRIIDLTGSKEGRKPDVATETWFRGRTVVFKDKIYRPPPEDKLEKFKQKMELKPMPLDIKKSLHVNLDGNLNAIHIHLNEKDNIKYKTYDPFNYKGLNIY